MSTSIVNPTNAITRPNAPLPFIRSASGKETVRVERPKDSFNNGKDYVDEGAPLLTSEGKTQPFKPYALVTNPLIAAPTPEEMKAFSRPDEVSQTQIKYLREAVVMDVDAKLLISSIDQMKHGVFREAHYPTLVDYMKSPYYRQLRESRIVAEKISGAAKKTRLKESETQVEVAGIRLNPKLVGLFKRTDNAIIRRLKESGFEKDLKRFREDAFTQDSPNLGSSVGSFGANFDGGQSFGVGGRETDFIPLMSGPYNKQLYWFDYLDMHSKAFEAWTHNPVAKRIVKVICQFVLGKGVKLTVMSAVKKGEEEFYKQQQMSAKNLNAMAQRVKNAAQGKQENKPSDWTMRAQTVLDRHWKKNKMHIRSKKMLRGLVVFGEQFIRYFDAPWGLKVRQIDPSTVWEVVTDPDDCEAEFYIHQQYPTRYQWYVDLPIPTIKFIIRQVPSAHYYHMMINTTEGEVRGRSELFAILGWLKRLKEYASDRVIRNKMANLFVLDVAVEGGAAEVQALQNQFSVPPTPGSFFIHNKAAELNGVRAEVGASDTQGDWEMLLTIIAMGAGLSQQYLGMSAGGGKAEALVGTEPDIKTFEDYQELMEDYFIEDAERVFERAKERGELPKDLTVSVEATFPALAEENRSEKLKDYAFGESMSWWSHRRTASAAAKEMQMTSYDYDKEQEAIAQEDATRDFLINTAYQQVAKGVDSGAQAGSGSGGTSSGSSGKGASGMGPGKALPSSSSSKQSVQASVRESDEDTAPGTSTRTHVSSFATTHNASQGRKSLPTNWRGSDIDSRTGRKDNYRNQDPRDIAESIKREAANLRYERRGVGRRQDRVQTPDKIRDQKTLDRSEVVTKAKRALKSGNFNKESIQRFPRERQ